MINCWLYRTKTGNYDWSSMHTEPERDSVTHEFKTEAEAIANLKDYMVTLYPRAELNIIKMY